MYNVTMNTLNFLIEITDTRLRMNITFLKVVQIRIVYTFFQL